MLCIYIDESGEHNAKTGHLKRLTLGGGLADSENWDCLSVKWEIALREMNIEMFHMTDFEADKGIFSGWKKDRPDDRKWLLATLLDLIVSYVPVLVGFSEEHGEHGPKFKDTYNKGIVDSLSHFASDLLKYPDPFALVYAKHPEYPQHLLEEHFGSIGSGDPRLRTFDIREPLGTYPLQAADIIAYEFSRCQREGRSERYPFKRLREGVSEMKLIWT